MERYKKYKEAFPNKTDAQCIESLCWEVSDKVETIHKLLHDKKYTEEDLLHAFREGVLLPNSQIGIMEDIFKQVVHSLNNKQD